jgi:hypothetical protein
MSGFVGLKGNGQSAARPRRFPRIRARRLTGVLATGALVLGGLAATAGVGAAPAAAGTTPATWIPLSPATSPPGQSHAAMAYDPDTSQMVLYSGVDGTTWTWDGTTWTQVASTGPAPRSGAAMAYDPDTLQILLFGGTDDTTFRQDSTTWTRVSSGSPAARTDASMAYDTDSGQLLLFGGSAAASDLDDTWTWDGTTSSWTQLSPVDSPPARSIASMAYVPSATPGAGRLVLFGGLTFPDAYLADTWTWDGTDWTEQSPVSSPSARGNITTAYDPDSGQLVLFGGNAGNGSGSDTWAWDGTDWTQLTPMTSPSARTGAALAYDPDTSQFLLFGGAHIGGDFDDTWTFGVPVPVTLNQTGDLTGTTTTTDSSAFTDQLATDEPYGAVSFVTTPATACGVVVSPAGVVSTTDSLSVGTCTVSGTDSDVENDTGVWSYTLTIDPVTITQVAPLGGTTTPAAAAAFTDQLATTGNGSVSFATTPATACGVTVSTGGAVSTAGPLATGTCTVSGTDTDTAGDTAGTWTYTLTVSAVAVAPPPRPVLTQAQPLSGTVSPAGLTHFRAHLAVAGSGGARYVTTSRWCGLAVSPAGVITIQGHLAAGGCTVSGTDSGAGAAGTWTYTLRVGTVTITQVKPWAATTTTAASPGFRGQFKTNGGRGQVRYRTTSRACGVTVSAGGTITTRGHLKAGQCTVSGTDADTTGAHGHWTFTLTITG